MDVRSGGKAAPLSTLPLEDPNHVATDDLMIRVVRLVERFCGESLSANHSPASLAVLEDTEQSPFFVLPSTTTRAAQVLLIAISWMIFFLSCH